ncbi:MAG: hypothetical protein ABL984_10970 [Pyrinomonadaceae bacterium]
MSDELLENHYPGIGRLYYFLSRIGMILVMVFAITFFGPESGTIGPISLLISVASVVLDVMRLRNIGLSQWFVFLRFIPYVGLLLSIGLQTAQGGWADSKRLDRAGLAILATHAAIIGLVIYLLFRTNLDIFGIAFR